MSPVVQVPAMFGHWLVEGDKLICRLPRKTVTVRAPRRLLLEVMRHCDGFNLWSTVVARLNKNWELPTLMAFLMQLLREGVLVEASQLWAHWGDIAQFPVVMVPTTEAEEISKLHQVAERRLLPGSGSLHKDIKLGRNQLAKTFAKRVSARTFDEKPISAEHLYSILWAAHGVTWCESGGAAPLLHRTTASGGNMHSARWFVVVLQALPSEDSQIEPIAPGVYEVRFHQEGGSSLKRLRGDVVDAWHCLRDPRVLRFASALILPVYDIATPSKKYGNRATMLALVEAGQCLQNAQLMAVELGVSGMLRGDIIAHVGRDMLNLKNGPAHWFVVPAMVVGAKASPAQMKQQKMESLLRFAPNTRTSEKSFAFAAAPATPDVIPKFTAGGRSQDPKLAATKAEAEAWERLAWKSPDNLEVGRFSEVLNAIDPQDLIKYSAHQYTQRGFHFSLFSPRRQYLWARAMDASSGKAHSVIADCVYAYESLPKRFQTNAFTSTSTSGMAAGISLQDALCRATLELIERDAFICTWVSTKAPQCVDAKTLPQTARRRIAELESMGFRIVVSDISRDWVPVISIFAQNNLMPLTLVTTAADFLPEQALEKALDEAEGRISAAQNLPPVDPGGVDPIREIERYYRDPKTYKNANFYANKSDSIAFRSAGFFACRNWQKLQSRMEQQGFNLLAVDMTPANATIEQGRVPLHVVRAFVPGLIPIWFQNEMQPKAMPRFSEHAAQAGDTSVGRFSIHPLT